MEPTTTARHLVIKLNGTTVVDTSNSYSGYFLLGVGDILVLYIDGIAEYDYTLISDNYVISHNLKRETKPSISEHIQYSAGFCLISKKGTKFSFPRKGYIYTIFEVFSSKLEDFYKDDSSVIVEDTVLPL